MKCVNAYTGQTYAFDEGSSDEKTLFKVMPLDSEKKIYFDTYDEYQLWKQREDKRRHRRRVGVETIDIVTI